MMSSSRGSHPSCRRKNQLGPLADGMGLGLVLMDDDMMMMMMMIHRFECGATCGNFLILSPFPFLF